MLNIHDLYSEFVSEGVEYLLGHYGWEEVEGIAQDALLGRLFTELEDAYIRFENRLEELEQGK